MASVSGEAHRSLVKRRVRLKPALVGWVLSATGAATISCWASAADRALRARGIRRGPRRARRWDSTCSTSGSTRLGCTMGRAQAGGAARGHRRIAHCRPVLGRREYAEDVPARASCGARRRVDALRPPPSEAGIARVAALSDPRITYRAEAVDAMEGGRALAGLRTMSGALHTSSPTRCGGSSRGASREPSRSPSSMSLRLRVFAGRPWCSPPSRCS